MKTTKETESMIRSMPAPVVVVFHGYESSIEHERYQNIPFEIRGQTIDYSSLSFEEIKTIYNQIIDEVKRIQKGDEILRPPADDGHLKRFPELKDYFYQRELGGELHTKIMFGYDGQMIER